MQGTELTELTKKIMAVIKAIPKGRVASYSQVAGLAGKPGGARAVARVLKSCSEKYELPWQRVINASGKIAFKPKSTNFMLQKRLLKAEGVEVNPATGAIDFKKYKYRKKPKVTRSRVQPKMFSD